MKKILLFAAVALFSSSLWAQPSKTSEKTEHLQHFDTSASRVKVSLNAYSFNKELDNYAKNKDGRKMTIFDLIDFCSLHKIPAIDLTGYYFPGYPEVPADDYIYTVKRYAHLKGVDISGTGVRNNFSNVDKAAREKDVQLVKDWIDVAAKLGAPVIRVFSGNVPEGYENNWKVPAEWIVECLKECAAYAAARGVIVGVQNHGDMLKTADETIQVINAVNSPWVGVIVDTGNFKVSNPYQDIEKVMPYAVNYQLKESAFGTNSNVRMDLPRLVKIIKESGYKGYLPIETLQMQGREYDPFTLVPTFLKEVNKAIEKEYMEAD